LTLATMNICQAMHQCQFLEKVVSIHLVLSHVLQSPNCPAASVTMPCKFNDSVCELMYVIVPSVC